jgi:hypothetical protein
LLGVFDVNETGECKSEEAQHLLPMDKGDYPRFPFFLYLTYEPSPCEFKELLAHHRKEEGEKE